MRIKAGIQQNPNDLSELIKMTYNVQQRFMDSAVFLFWRGRVLLYNGQQDLAKKHVRQALQIDPDNAKVKKFWKILQQAENLKGSAGQAFKDKMYEVAAGLYS